MNDYLKSLGTSDQMMEVVGKCILATKRNAVPENLLEKIIMDADTWHLGTPYFRKTDFLLKKK
ncbi:MAG: hypothetical protein ABIR15_15820 [Chitinophagaceae bacterium]